MLLLLLLSHFSSVRLCVTPWTASYQAPPPMGFSRQEHWSVLPFPPPMHESEKWKWSRSVVSDPQRPHGLQPTRLLRPWDFPGRSTGVGCHCLLQLRMLMTHKPFICPHFLTLDLRGAVVCLAAQLYLTLCYPMDCSPPGSSVHGDSSGRNTGAEVQSPCINYFCKGASQFSLMEWEIASPESRPLYSCFQLSH